MIVQTRDLVSAAVLDTVLLVLTPVNDPPVLRVPNFPMRQGESSIVSLPIFTEDPDDPLESLVWEGSGDENISVTVDSTGKATIQPAPTWYGGGQIHFQVTDPAGATDATTIQLTILRVNQAPTLGTLSDTTTAKGITLALDLPPLASGPGRCSGNPDLNDCRNPPGSGLDRRRPAELSRHLPVLRLMWKP